MEAAILAAGRVAVLGLGGFGGGAGAARFLARLGADVTVADDAEAERLAASIRALDGLGITFRPGRPSPDHLEGMRALVVNPAIPPSHPWLKRARELDIPVTTEIALAWRFAPGPILAVTGSNGKSTTAALAWEILRRLDPEARLGGNIGGSLLDSLTDGEISRAAASASFPVPTARTPTVLELSSFQLHYLEPGLPAPLAAAVTNLSPNHLDWHGSAEAYYDAKRNLFRLLKPAGYAIPPMDDPVASAWPAPDSPGEVLWTTTQIKDKRAAIAKGAMVGGKVFCLDGRRRLALRDIGVDGDDDERPALADLSRLRLPGAHNLANAVQAAALAWTWWRHYGGSAGAGKPSARAAFAAFAAAVESAAAEFPGLAHRLETVGVSPDGIRWINDSKATTPKASMLALRSLPGEQIALVAGGYDKGADFSAWAEAVRESARAVALVGEIAPRLDKALREAAAAGGRPDNLPPLAIHRQDADFDAAVRAAAKDCPPGGILLLSPACASWGMFRNYEERGDRFRALFR